MSDMSKENKEVQMRMDPIRDKEGKVSFEPETSDMVANTKPDTDEKVEKKKTNFDPDKLIKDVEEKYAEEDWRDR